MRQPARGTLLALLRADAGEQLSLRLGEGRWDPRQGRQLKMCTGRGTCVGRAGCVAAVRAAGAAAQIHQAAMSAMPPVRAAGALGATRHISAGTCCGHRGRVMCAPPCTRAMRRLDGMTRPLPAASCCVWRGSCVPEGWQPLSVTGLLLHHVPLHFYSWRRARNEDGKEAAAAAAAAAVEEEGGGGV